MAVPATIDLCAYCGGDATTGPFNAEHVLPQALGGNLEPTNPFRIRTHEQCNRRCGTWVDAPFVRSWLVHNARVTAGYDFVDPSREPIMPLYFLGRLDAYDQDDRICDLWLGPTGDHIYHFHRPYPISPAIVGSPNWIRRDQLDPGVAFVRIVGTNPAWHSIIINSIKSAFPRAGRYYLNVEHQGQGPPYPAIPAEHAGLVSWIESLPSDNSREWNVSFDPECGHRFLLKMALGIGAVALGAAYVVSPYAQRLQQALGQQDITSWPPDIYGTAFFRSQRPQSFTLLDWNGCHTIVLTELRDGGRRALGLTLNLYGTHSATVMVSDDPSLWAGRVFESGTVWVVAPGLRRFAGPMSMVAYMNERLRGAGAMLGPLLGFIQNATKLPAFHLPQEETRKHDAIAVAAYYRWLARGGESAPNAALDDWLTAELEILSGVA